MSTSKKAIIFPKHQDILDILGENIKLARLRRGLTMAQVSERSDIARSTLFLIEKGSSSVSIGHYFNVLRSLNLHQDFLKVAADDILGRKLQDLELLRGDTQTINASNFIFTTNKDRKNRVKQTYLMINSEGHTKIGKSFNPKDREKTLQSQEPFIELYAVSTSDIETVLHDKYANKRMRGEWFNLERHDIIDIIEEFGFVEINKSM